MVDIILSKSKKIFQLRHPVLSANRIILITGASSGIGRALACHYAKDGHILLLWGRSEEKLKKTADICEGKGAVTYSFPVDLSDHEVALELLETLIDKFPIDMAILAAGSGDIRKNDEVLEAPETLLNLFKLNYATPTLMANRLAQQMIHRHIKGQLVFIGSVAAFHSLPFATAYSSSKAGLEKFADSLRIAVKKWGIKVNLITPGFIDTPMSQRLQCHKPFLMPLDQAVQEITQAIQDNKRHLILPKLFIVLKWIDILAPAFLRDFILSHIKVKQD